MSDRPTHDTSLFKFSEITREHFNVGAAVFILQNMGALDRKDKKVVVKLVEEICSAYLVEHGVTPPQADYSVPVV